MEIVSRILLIFGIIDTYLIRPNSAFIKSTQIQPKFGVFNTKKNNVNDAFYFSRSTPGTNFSSMKRNYRHTLKATIEENSSSSAEDKKDETKSRESEDEGSGINPKMEDIEANAIDILSLDPSAINIQPVYDDRASVKKRQSVSKPFYENSNIGMNFDTKIPSTPNINEPTKVLSESKFVNMFRSCASYIANHRGSTIVYHVPGEFLEHSDFADLMDDIALTWLLGMKIVLVVGCSKFNNFKIISAP